jgi:hypothetical protein
MSIRRSARLVLNRLAVLGLGCTLSGHAAWTPAQEPPPGTLYSRPSDPAPPPPSDTSDSRPQEPSPAPPGPYVPVYLAVPPAGSAPAQPAALPDLVPGAPWDRVTREPRKVNSKSEGGWGSWTSQVTWQDGRTGIWDEPLLKRTWQTQESWQLAVAGPVFFFGQLGATSEEAAQQDLKVNGRTGLACKVPLAPGAEFLVRSGPGVSYTDPLRPVSTREQRDWLLEVQARCPLVAGVGLEYQGSAAPALTPMQQDWIKHDLSLAFPVGTAGKFQVGARHRWQNAPAGAAGTSTTGLNSQELYLGLELKR